MFVGYYQMQIQKLQFYQKEYFKGSLSSLDFTLFRGIQELELRGCELDVVGMLENFCASAMANPSYSI